MRSTVKQSGALWMSSEVDRRLKVGPARQDQIASFSGIRFVKFDIEQSMIGENFEQDGPLKHLPSPALDASAPMLPSPRLRFCQWYNAHQIRAGLGVV